MDSSNWQGWTGPLGKCGLLENGKCHNENTFLTAMTRAAEWSERPAKTQISRDIRPVWSEYLLCAQWVAKDPRQRRLLSDSAGFAQTTTQDILSDRSLFPAATLCSFKAAITEPRHDKTNKVTMRPAKTQISLGIRPVWSESSPSAWRKLGSLPTHWAHSEDSGQTGRMPRLIWVFAGHTLTLLVLSCRDSTVK